LFASAGKASPTHAAAPKEHRILAGMAFAHDNILAISVANSFATMAHVN
jgi:hypothetical protein